MADAGRGYIPKSDHWKTRQGFRNYLDREEKVKHTPNCQADELSKYLKAIEGDVRDFLSDGCGGTFTMAQLARAVDPADVWYHTEKLEPLLDMLEEFRENLPQKESV